MIEQVESEIKRHMKAFAIKAIEDGKQGRKEHQIFRVGCIKGMQKSLEIMKEELN